MFRFCSLEYLSILTKRKQRNNVCGVIVKGNVRMRAQNFTYYKNLYYSLVCNLAISCHQKTEAQAQHKCTKMNAKPAAFNTIDKGIPYLPFPNSPLTKGQKHNTIKTLYKYSPTPTLSCSCPNKLNAKAVKFTNRKVVPGMNIGDSSNVNLPTLFLETSWSLRSSES